MLPLDAVATAHRSLTGLLPRLDDYRSQNSYFPLFVSRKALEAEKAHVEGFAAEVAWVTKVSPCTCFSQACDGCAFTPSRLEILKFPLITDVIFGNTVGITDEQPPLLPVLSAMFGFTSSMPWDQNEAGHGHHTRQIFLPCV